MAAANGTYTPPDGPPLEQRLDAPASADKKRKRDGESDLAALATITSSRQVQTQKDILEILEQHDTTPSFLKHTIDAESASTEPSSKKVRLSDPTNTLVTIASKLSSGAYTSLKDLSKDAERVSEHLATYVRTNAKKREGQNGRLLVDDLKQVQRTQAFEQFVKDVVEQEAKYDAAHGEAEAKLKQESGNLPNGHTPHRPAAAAATVDRNGTILTLFGNAGNPKQLFSSMQNSPREKEERSMKTELPVEEMGLPTGLAATKILAVPADEVQPGPTFEEAFAPPYNLPALPPPKANYRRSTMRDEVIKWEFKDPYAVRNKRAGYTAQSLTVGEWLGYGGPDAKDEPSSPREKRKMRDRALSSGESTQPPLNKDSLEDALAKEEEMLFRKAYSSFAPSCDNGKALVSDEVKSMVWWHKVGARRYQETFAIDPALLDEPLAQSYETLPTSKMDDEDFSKVVEDLDQWGEDPLDVERETDKTNVNEVLREISNLLETLASHQRVRTASLQNSVSAARTPISPVPTLAALVGRPDTPAEDEMSTYHALRRELTYLILKLPPYAVAKLNGDQLAELGVSTIITLEGKNMKGTMEEDQVARLAKYTSQTTAHSITTLSRTGSGSQHYSSTSQRTPAIGQAANTRYGQSQYGIRGTPATQPQFNRSLSNQSTYNTPTATAPRTDYAQRYHQFPGPQAAQPAHWSSTSQYTQALRQQVAPGTPAQGAYNPYKNSTPSTQQQQHPRPSYPTPSQPLAQFTQRSHAAAQNAVAYQTNAAQHVAQVQSPYNRTASPLKPANYQPPLQPSPVPRVQQQFQPPPPAGTDRATPLSYPSLPHTPVNGVSQQQQQQQQQPRTVAPRTSGTPQPVVPALQTNGHV